MIEADDFNLPEPEPLAEPPAVEFEVVLELVPGLELLLGGVARLAISERKGEKCEYG